MPAQQAEQPGASIGRLVLREPRQPGTAGVADVHRSGARPGDPGHRNPDPARCLVSPSPCRLAPRSSCDSTLGPPLTLVQHREADVDLGDPAGHPVVGDRQRLAQPAYVIEAQRGVQEGQPDRGTVGGKRGGAPGTGTLMIAWRARSCCPRPDLPEPPDASPTPATPRTGRRSSYIPHGAACRTHVLQHDHRSDRSGACTHSGQTTTRRRFLP